MDLASLQAFLAIAETGSFSAAGERLHLTQPAISKRIAVLEAQLQRRLFDRIGREVALTEAGQALLPRARGILDELDDARRELDNLGSRVGSRLSLATSHHIGLHRLPPLLRQFGQSHPQAALDIRFLDSEQAWSEVLHGRAELAVTTLGPAAPPLRTTPVWDDPLEFVVAPDHPLAGRCNIGLAELAAHPAVLPDANTFTHRIVAERFAAAGLSLSLRMTTNYMETNKMLVAVGLAWSVLPHTLIDTQTTVLDVPGVRLSRQLGHVSHAGRTLSNAARAFMALLDAEAAAGSVE
ncbi:LysR family transcriptional regulator [Pseudoxanthomonas kalamensis DSM 18571]|uniref:LysR family transcriptional regulator n=1 Tax=Pseudoxanthomonas kalamensis TaxID=289483 RepID=UPI001391E0FA|nr:LysR family transcriptional regulator [Pseudoxanthomonas kalamensis]KAF1712071.1 LysR family transcriptional regulator [Pseudoxanthomonas kalamensis DSM 18571]